MIEFLDFYRPCTADCAEACWLCDELTLWNKVLNNYGLNLSESEPGNLALTSFQFCHCMEAAFCKLEEPYGSSFFLTWLPRKHRCVQTMRLDSIARRWTFDMTEELSGKLQNIGDTTDLRHLELEGDVNVQEACGALEASVARLESIHLTDIICDGEPVSFEVATLVNRASPRLGRLTVDDYFMSDSNGMLDALLRCPQLTDLTLKLPLIKELPLRVVDLLEHLPELRKLCLDVPEREWCCTYSGLYTAFTSTTRLEDLHVVVRTEAFAEALCSAVKFAASLKAFHLENFCEHEFCVEEQVASLLCDNTTLQMLRVSNFEFHDAGTELITSALARNVVLEILDLSDSKVTTYAFVDLIGALDYNGSLKKLKIGKVPYLPEGDVFLSALITHHGRIEILSWSDKLVKVIGNILSSPEACPQHLVLDARSKLSGPSLHLLNESLRAVTCSVRTLTLVVSHGIGPSIGDLFCPILSRAWTITALKLQLHKVTLSHGFLNPEWPGGIHFGYPQGECESDDWPTHQMGKIGTVARKKIGDEYDCCCQGILSLALCLRHNATVTSFDIDGIRVDFPGFVVSRSTTRNLSMLNDAVRFVIYESLDKNRALAFENLADYPSLRDQLTKLTGMSEAVCAAAIESANSWLRKMFFVITGVVCSSVKCHSSQRVQLDALSDSCVQGITRYLSVTDVKDEE
ncbi:hypothetical protein HPB48_007911 [Haemaphysalis longicornis]|uniref:Uncharacterized protein n=1 Tax=Haemaphysalis longicornis TaxID=44386 RepID=A0A9J6GKY2_HAELO|nr:hypothetical protein HPB48_007911 [Haemaphysalis longicornis]